MRLLKKMLIVSATVIVAACSGKASVSQSDENQAYDNMLTAYENSYAVISPKSPKFDKAKVQELEAEQSKLEKSGLSATQALAHAVFKILGNAPDTRIKPFIWPKKPTVFIHGTCDSGTVLDQIIYSMHEKLAGSQTLEATNSQDNAVLEISFQCLGAESNSYVVNYTYAITLKSHSALNYLASDGIGTCGSNRVDECAAGLVSDIAAVARSISVAVDENRL